MKAQRRYMSSGGRDEGKRRKVVYIKLHRFKHSCP